MEVNIGISDRNRQVICDGLGTVLANVYALYVKTQNFHWNVEGPEFFSLHLLFEKHYEIMAGQLDEIAERIRALGFYVDASFSGFKKLSMVKDDNKVLNAKEMLSHLVEGHEATINHGRKVAEIADNEKDFASVDMVGRILGAHEKMAWMLRSQLS